LLQEVKLQNNMKDEEIKALRDRMIKMESIIPVQDDDVNGREEGVSPKRGDDGAGDNGAADDTQQPEVRVQRLMEEDPAFRRGRLRWLKQEQQRILNLQQQNIAKKLRGQNQGQNSPVVPVHLPGTGRFIPPQECKLKFPFKSNPAHRLSWGPASAALQALGLGEGGGEEGEQQQEEVGGGGGCEGKASPSPPPPQGLLPIPFQAPPPRMRTPSPHRAWQQRNQGNQGNQGGFYHQHHGNNNNHQRRYRRNSLDSSPHRNYDNDQRHGGGGGHQGRPRQRRGVSPGPGGERGGGRGGGGGGGRDREGGFHYNQHHQFHHHPYYNPHNAPFQPGPHPNYHSLPRSGVPPPPADMLLGAGPPPGGWGFTTPPRMRRQFSAPDLKNNKETPI
ncbi:kinesin-like protein KIF1C, partial [Plectropomus leopardus]|uniref:kinesin-like protein KIF1C n=1 Tax=Plectropomus leopardus TaxID=160734 RepID=UPI001C4B4EEC